MASHDETWPTTRSSSLADLSLARTKINFSWFLKLRWAAVLGQVVTIAVVALALGIKEPLVCFAVFIAFEILVNVMLSAWFLRNSTPDAWPSWASRAETLLGCLMVFDLLLLSGLLFVSGGSANPFAIFFLVNLTLGAIVLRATWAWVLSAFTLVCFAALFQFHQDLAGLGAVRLASVRAVFSGATSEPFQLYMAGKFVAVATVSVILVYFITRLTSELRRREEELALAEELRQQAERLEALGTLAAGAAHELASPLSTIAVVVRDLEQQSVKPDAAFAVEDVELIRSEIRRCRDILDQMAMGAGKSMCEELADLTVDTLVKRVFEEPQIDVKVERKIQPAASEILVRIPPRAFVRAVRAVVKNASDASRRQGVVDFECGVYDGRLQIAVRDRGEGMTADVLARVGEPFFTTKEPGQGMGLGLFISRAVVEQVGGTLSLDSTQGSGTMVVITVPAFGVESGKP